MTEPGEFFDVNTLVQSILKDTSLQLITLMMDKGILKVEDSKEAVQLASFIANNVKIQSLSTPDEKQKPEVKEVKRRPLSDLTKNDDAYINRLIESNRKK